MIDSFMTDQREHLALQFSFGPILQPSDSTDEQTHKAQGIPLREGSTTRVSHQSLQSSGLMTSSEPWRFGSKAVTSIGFLF
mmetsp:Transcript_8381/g.20173  ORF Transcript_8381/g.20173 Transcript_8381/m.20173 type:complete len:81 (+) Transcript_8381:1815-2057(+)